MKKNNSPNTLAKGFSLLELVIVLSIMTILAGTFLVSLDDSSEEARSTLIQQQHAAIRSAILGSHSVSPRGVVTSSGYISDIGERPNTVSALLLNPNANEPVPAAFTYPAPRYLAIKGLWRKVGDEVADEDWSSSFNDPESRADILLKHGWRGPYLDGDYAEGENDGTAILYDAWGNDWDANYEDGTSVDSVTDGIEFFSFSKDQQEDVEATGNGPESEDIDPYSVDYPAQPSKRVVAKTSFEVDLAETFLPSLIIENNTDEELILGLIYPGIDLNDEIGEVGAYHSSVIRNSSDDAIMVPMMTEAAPTTILNSSSELTAYFRGHPTAYRYQVVLYKVGASDSDSLAKRLYAVYPDVFFFAPRYTHSQPLVSSSPDFNWLISSESEGSGN